MRVKINIDREKCKGCGLCIMHCPKKILVFSKKTNKFGTLYVEYIDESSCAGCGFCYLMCPEAAIEILEEDGKESTKNNKGKK